MISEEEKNRTKVGVKEIPTKNKEQTITERLRANII